MLRKAFGLVLFVGCASPSYNDTAQGVADPNPSFAITAANFVSPVGGSSISTCGSGAACATAPTAQIRWGTPAYSTEQSGLGFEPGAAQPISYNTAFALGDLTHFNFPTIAGTSATGATLRLHLTVSPSDPTATLIADGDIDIPFNIDETSNYEDPANGITCPYPSEPGNPCSDKVTFGTATFTLGSTTSTTVYDLRITGFVAPGTTTPVDSLISDENGSNSAILMGTLREHCIDTDDDGVCDEFDNCVDTANADQLDTDGDGAGDACDVCPQHAEDDPDGDGVCGLPEPCPCDADWKNHGEYVSCVAHATNEQVREGTLTHTQRALLVSAAGQSSCGK